MSARSRHQCDWLLALAGTMLANLLLFSVPPLLVQSHVPRLRPEVYPVTTFLPPQEEPPPEEEDQPPPPPRPPELPPPRQLKLESLPAPRLDLPRPQLDLELAPSLAGTLALAPPPSGRFRLGQVDQPPMVTAQIPPPYPFLARRRGIQGWVRVRFLVDRRGQVRELTIVEAQPPGVFEDTVRRTLPRWRFRPGVKDGRPVDTWVETVIRFKLEGR